MKMYYMVQYIICISYVFSFTIYLLTHTVHIFKLHFHVITDVIGVLDEIGYTQPTKGSRKVQVNFKLRDLM
jgi:hypothetical protein